jgi:membrane protein DedA with SNARE-associated domain
MSLGDLIGQYGYGAVFLGAFFEGESLLVLAGFAAHQGYLKLPWVMLVAMAGGFLGDQLFFWLGRRHGPWVRGRFPTLQPGFRRSDALIERHHRLLIVGVRFLYGLRTVGPMAIGMSGVPPMRFALLNGLGALLWAALVGGAGYLFGQVLQDMLGDVKAVEQAVFAGMLLAGLVFGLARRHYVKRHSPPAQHPPQEDEAAERTAK